MFCNIASPTHHGVDSRVIARLAGAIRSAAVALLLAAALPIAAQAQSGSTKFIPTFLVYYGGGPTFATSDVSKLAKFDLIDTDRFRYRDIGSNTWSAIKAINPNSQIYLYEMGPEFYNSQDATAQVYLNTLGRHNVSRGHPMGSLNGNQPALFQLDSTGKRIYSTAYSNVRTGVYSYLMDFGSTAYQSYWVTAVKADIIDQPWVADGLFADNCLTLAAAGGYSATSAWYSTNAAWSSAMNSFVGAITTGLHGYSQKLWCNRGSTTTVDGSASWLTLDSSATPPDIILEEGAFAVMWGATVQFFPEASWRRQVDTMAAIKNSKVAMLSHTQLAPGQSGTDNWGKPVTYWQALWYSMASFLLGKNDVLGNAYFMFNGGSGFNRIWWNDEYDKIDLGKALGPYSVRTISGVNIYAREFEKGFVYVNPTSNDVASVTLPQALQQITHDNLLSALSSIPSVTTISLIGHNPAILLKTAAADTTAPTVPAGLSASAVSSSQIDLSWTASTDNVGVTGYRVYRNGTLIATLGAVTVYKNTALAASTSFTYTVQALDEAGNASAQSTAASATTPASSDTIAPSVPTGLTATAASPTQVNLAWNASTDNVAVTGYYVYLNGVALTTTSATSFQHTGLTAGGTYNYRVSAYDAVPNHSAWTATPVSVTIPAADTQAPSVPTGLAGTAVSSTQINLSWNASTDNVGVTGYYVYLNGVALTTTTGTSFQHTGLRLGTNYKYRVSAYDAVPNHSAWTATVTVRTRK
ncbi:MAG: putative glycoside hydrolase [Betaproteobacteria bacterium]